MEARSPPTTDVSRHRLLLFAMFVALGLGMAFGASAQQEPRLGLVLKVDGAIGPASADYIGRGLKSAAARGAAVVILEMNTPGGLDTSMREIIGAIIASPVPVATYVSPSGARAASAGTYILYASHIAAMAPGTNLGAATPVAIGGFPIPGREDGRPKPGAEKPDGEPSDKGGGQDGLPGNAMEAKVINDAVAYIRALAEMRERNADWGEEAVRQAASLPAREARERKVVDLVATGLDDLISQMHGRTVRVGERDLQLDTEGLTIERVEPDWRTRLLGVITNPNVALILMMIGIYGLVFEFMSPGALYPGTIGAICLLTGLYALAALPVSYAGAGLMALGLALMIAEAFSPSLGVLGIGGAIAFLLGATILIDTEVPDFAISWPVIWGITATTAGFSLVVVRLAISSRRRPVVSGREEMVGLAGKVDDWSGTEGHVHVHGERWRATAGSPLAPGQHIRVLALEGLTLRVEADNTI